MMHTSHLIQWLKQFSTPLIQSAILQVKSNNLKPIRRNPTNHHTMSSHTTNEIDGAYDAKQIQRIYE